MWRERLQQHLVGLDHPVWGPSHWKRVSDLTLRLAEEEGAYVDEDVVWAAARLHDIGAFEPYRREGVDHAERSAAAAPVILEQIGFDPAREALVCDVIRGHMFYADPEASAEARLFHDADTLDFMGALGVARLFAMVGIDDWAPDMHSAAELVRRYRRELPEALVTESARRIAETRQARMDEFLTWLSQESDGMRLF